MVLVHTQSVYSKLCYATLQLLQNTDLFVTGGDDSESEGECTKLGPPSASLPPPATRKERKKKSKVTERPQKEKKVCVRLRVFMWFNGL